MSREELKELGLTDEQIDKVMANYGKSVKEIKEKADKAESAEAQIEDYKQQIKDRDKQLTDLEGKAKGNEDLEAEIKKLKADNETATTELQAKLDKQIYDFALEKALTKANVRNPKAIKALLNTETIKLDGETLLGLDDQLEAVKKSDPYLFEAEPKDPDTPKFVAPGNPKGGKNGKDDPFTAAANKFIK